MATIINAIPDSFYKKAKEAFLFLFAYQTGQHSFTCHETRIKDIQCIVFLNNGRHTIIVSNI